MLLKDLIRDVEVLGVDGSLDREIPGVAYDSRQVTPGMLFAAIPGNQVDGAEFIGSAIERGAVAVVCGPAATVSAKATRIRVADVREALARISVAYYQNPSARLMVIGVTGTNGKTTVAFMIKAILEAGGIKTGLLGTVRYEIGDRIIPAQRTTPEALEVQQMMAQMVRVGCRACVMEVSSHALEQHRVLGVEFDVAVFTNLTQDHLDYHATMANYFASKRKLFLSLDQSPKEGSAVINIDDASGLELSTQLKRSRLLTYAIEKPAQLRATRIELSKEGARFVLEGTGKRFACRLPLLGRHNVYNALAAIGSAMCLEVDVLAVQAALNAMPPVPGRLEPIDNGQPFGVVVDYAHTEDALLNVLSSLKEVYPGRTLLAFGCGGCRDTAKRPRMGRVAAQLADFTLITSDNPRKESPAQIASQVEAGYRGHRQDGYRIELDRRRAIQEIVALGRPGDVIVIAGKGHETYQEFEDTVIPFDDRAYVQETLENLGYRKS